MSHGGFRHGPDPGRQRPFPRLLDQFTVRDIRAWEEKKDRILRFHWDYHQELSYQRKQAAESLRQALLEAAEGPFRFAHWQRVVRIQHVTEPLSVAGSLRSDPGGRFNVGALDPDIFPPFPALYAASDKGTALQEYLCQSLPGTSDLTPHEYALADPTSMANISLSGTLDRIVSLRDPKRLKVFVEILAGFRLSRKLKREAKALGLQEPRLVRTMPDFMSVVLNRDWRMWPMAYDLPAQPQIFGALVAEAGIEAIVYPSKFTTLDCLAAYPHNFRGPDSYVELDDTPPPNTRVRRLDAVSWTEHRPILS